MPSLEAAIEARALAFAGLTNLLGTNPVRFYPSQAEQGINLPYVVYSLVDDPPVHVMSADQESQARVQFDVFASSWVIARQVRDQLLLCFDRLVGAFGGATISGSVCENRGMMLEPDETSLLRRVTMEFQMTYLST